MKQTNERKSNFELLRIVLALFVIIIHYGNGVMGGVESFAERGSFNYYLVKIVSSISIIAVNTFVIITGYFMNSKKEIKIAKPLKLFYLTAIYGILFYFLFVIMGRESINKISIYQFIRSITDKWFITIYIILYLLIPYINKVIQSINKKQFITLLSMLFVFFCIWPTLWTSVTVKDEGFGIINFIFLYLIGAFIKLYADDFNSFWYSFLVYVICTITTMIYRIILEKAFDYNSIFVVIGAVAFFEMFKALKIKNSKIINKISEFAVTSYIIHENSFLVKPLYREIFKTPDYYNSPYMFLNLIFTTIGIYVLCMIIESIRRLVMKKLDEKIDNVKISIK